PCPRQVIVGRLDDGYGHGERRIALTKHHEAAVMGAVEYQKFGSLRRVPRQLSGEQAGFGTGIAESDLLYRGYALRDEFREFHFMGVRTAQGNARARGLLNGLMDGLAAMTENPSREVADQIEVLVPVHIGDSCALAVGHGERERSVVQGLA